MSNSRLVASAACAALVIGSLGPWQGSQPGTDGGGVYTLLLALMAGLLLMPKASSATAVIALGVVCTGITIVNVVDVAGSTRLPLGIQPPSVEVGWGLWLASLSSLALIASACSLRRELVGPSTAAVRTKGTAERWIREHPAIFGLAVLVGLGALLRIWLTLVWSPAFTGYSDSGIYFQGAYESIWSDPIRMVGYSMFVEALHAVIPHLLALIVIQHVMGLGGAALLFLAVRRCGGPQWLGLLPAAVICLGGDELFLEHAALSDALFIFLIAATLYATVRAAEDRAWWAAIAGLLCGLAVWDRTVGLGLLAVITLWLVFSFGRPTRRTLAVGALALFTSLTVVAGYAVWRSAATDQPGTLTSNNAWNLYGRVAPWADCDKFTPPAGTEVLCEKTPASQRGYHSGEEYIYSAESPAQRLYGPPYLVSDPHGMEQLQEWSGAAIRGQPLDYLNAVWLDTRRLFSPNAPSYGDLTADAFTSYLLYGLDGHSGHNEFVESWQSRLYPHDPPPHRGDISPFRTWEAMTRIVSLWMAIGLALCLAGPWVLSGRSRAGMILFGATALMFLFFPIVTKSYDYRFTVPAFAPLAAAAALAAWGLVGAIRRRSADLPRFADSP